MIRIRIANKSKYQCAVNNEKLLLDVNTGVICRCAKGLNFVRLKSTDKYFCFSRLPHSMVFLLSVVNKNKVSKIVGKQQHSMSMLCVDWKDDTWGWHWASSGVRRGQAGRSSHGRHRETNNHSPSPIVGVSQSKWRPQCWLLH